MENKKKYPKSKGFTPRKPGGGKFVRKGGPGGSGGPKGSKGPKKFKKIDPEIKAKAEKMVEKNGIPFRYALDVAQGKKKLTEVLNELLHKNKIDQLMKKHDLPRALAGQVVKKKITLDEALQVVSYQKMKKQFALKSCFQESNQKKSAFVFHCHGPASRIGVIQTNDKYDVDFVAEGAEEVVRFPKLEVKFAYPLAKQEKISPKIAIDKDVIAQGLEPIKRIVERNRIKNSLLRRYMFGQRKVRFVTLEGDVMDGSVLWFNLYEIYVDLGDGAYVYLLRHCLYSWDEIPGQEVPGEAEGAGGAEEEKNEAKKEAKKEEKKEAKKEEKKEAKKEEKKKN